MNRDTPSLPAHLRERATHWLARGMPPGQVIARLEAEGVPTATASPLVRLLLTGTAPVAAGGAPSCWPDAFPFADRHEAAFEGHRMRLLARLQAPAIALVAYDTRFFELMAEVFPRKPEARTWFEGDKQIDRTALRNSSLEGGYLILAARALGLDCGPMSGFKEDAVNAEFFPDGRWRVNFICNLGYAEGDNIPPRLPRLSFETACRVL